MANQCRKSYKFGVSQSPLNNLRTPLHCAEVQKFRSNLPFYGQRKIYSNNKTGVASATVRYTRLKANHQLFLFVPPSRLLCEFISVMYDTVQWHSFFSNFQNAIYAKKYRTAISSTFLYVLEMKKITLNGILCCKEVSAMVGLLRLDYTVKKIST